MSEPQLTDDELKRIRRDLAAADKAESWLASKLMPWLGAHWPKAASFIAGGLAWLGIGHVTGWTTRTVELPGPIRTQPAKEIVIKTEPVDHGKIMRDVIDAMRAPTSVKSEGPPKKE